jgi:hypothetical protein
MPAAAAVESAIPRLRDIVVARFHVPRQITFRDHVARDRSYRIAMPVKEPQNVDGLVRIDLDVLKIQFKSDERATRRQHLLATL